MKIMVLITRGEGQCFIVDVLRRSSAVRVRRLVDGARYADAIIAALSGGVFVEEIVPARMHDKKADLIITEHSAHWDSASRPVHTA